MILLSCFRVWVMDKCRVSSNFWTFSLILVISRENCSWNVSLHSSFWDSTFFFLSSLSWSPNTSAVDESAVCKSWCDRQRIYINNMSIFPHLHSSKLSKESFIQFSNKFITDWKPKYEQRATLLQQPLPWHTISPDWLLYTASLQSPYGAPPDGAVHLCLVLLTGGLS